jgi:hypothetical protein
MRSRNIHYLLPFLLLPMLIGGCTSTPTESPSDPTRRPGVGSWYAYSRMATDANNIPTGTAILDTLTVVSTGQSYKGRSDLHRLESRMRALYVGYESNNDVVSRDDTCECWGNWIPYTVGTRERRTLPTKDTVLFAQTAGAYHHTITEVIEHQGIESVTVPAGTFQAHRLKLVRTESGAKSTGTVTITTTTTYYFAPTIGYLVKTVVRDETRSSTQPGIITAFGSEQVLTAYEVK